ncbi:oxidoreductase [Catellatospora sp. TT07R-123]|uniref:nitroreductase family protein n=1 Tax=Catellatospora sp. TT07R-123 TaxID=2733863 RepID=UPI001B269A09|nr:nitroreductase family protein [Catellatospora sp. TT07R-123]GHJ42824.1 oxidoreductase [Catellatospora sp. TT07R-123]
MDADEVLTTTRSVRRRLDLSRPVDLGLVRDCLRVAVQAPTGGNRQHWRFIVVTDPALRQGVGAVYRAAFEARYPADAQGPHRELASARHLAEQLHRVPVLVIPCLELPDGQLPAGNQAGLWGSLLPAAWSYMLAARARGLGTAWTTVHLDREAEVARLLNLPDRVRQGALIPTAHTTGTFRAAARLPLHAVVHLDGWNTP